MNTRYCPNCGCTSHEYIGIKRVQDEAWKRYQCLDCEKEISEDTLGNWTEFNYADDYEKPEIHVMDILEPRKSAWMGLVKTRKLGNKYEATDGHEEAIGATCCDAIDSLWEKVREEVENDQKRQMGI